MSFLSHQSLIKFLKVFNLLLMALSLTAASWVVYGRFGEITLSEILTARVKLQNFAIFLTYLFAWNFIFRAFKFYDSRKLYFKGEDTFDVIKATFLSSLVIYFSSIIFDIELISLLLLVHFWIMSSFLLILARQLVAIGLKKLTERKNNLRHVVIVGTNQRAIEFAENLENNMGLGCRLVGFVDDLWQENTGSSILRYPIVSNLSNFFDFVRNQVIDEVIILIPVKSYFDEISKIISFCEEQGIVARMGSFNFHGKLLTGNNKALTEEPQVIVRPGSMLGWKYFVKRLIDLCIAGTLIIILSPLFLFLALIIKINSKGAILYKQKRIGFNKRKFTLYKFRTMIDGADKKLPELEHLNELTGPVFKIKNDPRVTFVGKILRKTSLDELPQLYNILKGEMSLVGPRPFSLRDYRLVDQDWHRRRCSVPPGITCLWQVEGRNSIPFERWMELDMQYIDHWSLLLDLKILLKTIPAVLTGRGAV